MRIMDKNDIPSLKKKTLTERITLPLESGLKSELESLKRDHGVDTSEWLRRLIRAELPKLRQRVSV